MSERKMKEVELKSFSKFEKENDKFSGKYVKTYEVIGKNGEFPVVVLDSEGEELNVPVTEVLTKKMSEVKPGDFIEIQWLGKKQSQKDATRQYNDYALFVEEKE